MTIQQIKDKLDEYKLRTGLFSIGKVEFLDTQKDILDKLFEVNDKANVLARQLVWQNKVATYTDLGVTYPIPAVNWAVLVEDEGFVYAWNGDWVNTGLTYDQMYIPLAGTTPETPVTGDIVFAAQRGIKNLDGSAQINFMDNGINLWGDGNLYFGTDSSVYITAQNDIDIRATDYLSVNGFTIDLNTFGNGKAYYNGAEIATEDDIQGVYLPLSGGIIKGTVSLRNSNDTNILNITDAGIYSNRTIKINSPAAGVQIGNTGDLFPSIIVDCVNSTIGLTGSNLNVNTNNGTSITGLSTIIKTFNYSTIFNLSNAGITMTGKNIAVGDNDVKGLFVDTVNNQVRLRSSYSNGIYMGNESLVAGDWDSSCYVEISQNDRKVEIRGDKTPWNDTYIKVCGYDGIEMKAPVIYLNDSAVLIDNKILITPYSEIMVYDWIVFSNGKGIQSDSAVFTISNSYTALIHSNENEIVFYDYNFCPIIQSYATNNKYYGFGGALMIDTSAYANIYYGKHGAPVIHSNMYYTGYNAFQGVELIYTDNTYVRYRGISGMPLIDSSIDGNLFCDQSGNVVLLASDGAGVILMDNSGTNIISKDINTDKITIGDNRSGVYVELDSVLSTIDFSGTPGVQFYPGINFRIAGDIYMDGAFFANELYAQVLTNDYMILPNIPKAPDLSQLDEAQIYVDADGFLKIKMTA